jgi:hypothetical protein
MILKSLGIIKYLRQTSDISREKPVARARQDSWMQFNFQACPRAKADRPENAQI